MQLARRSLGQRHFGKGALAALVIELANLCELMASRGAMDQLRPEPGLNRLDVLGNHGRGHLRDLRGGRETAIVDDPDEHRHA